MQHNLWIIFTTLGLYAAIIVSPGPNFALVSRLSMSGALPSALGATLGLSLAATLYAVLSMTGLAILITRVDWLATAVQAVGGAYLIYLGLNSWFASPSRDEAVKSTGGTFWSGLHMGTLVEMTNPKGIAFFLGLYAMAIPADAGIPLKLAVLAGGFILEMLWYGFVAVVMSTPPVQAAYKKSGGWIDRLTGTLLIGFGIKMLAERI
ncbi:LysE family transporter [Mesorhizobium sp. M1005]|uniref:LysE family translocator n=1 Tax=unclassified Mesorhizobium TaxID=325217 RepID=UPI0033360437